MLLLRSTLNARIGKTGLTGGYVGQLWGSALAAAAIAWGIKLVLPSLHPVVTATLVLGPYGLAFFGATTMLKIPEASALLTRFTGRGGLRSRQT